VFGGGHPRFRDMAHVSEYRCIFHLPYQTNVQALWENLGYCNIYLIPSKRFITELINTESWYYGEEKTKGGELLQKSIELAEWYQPELAEFFVYFDSWEDIHAKFYETDFMEKKRDLYEYMQKNNRTHIGRWSHLFESFTI
jgi:alpha-L-fucosidase